MAIKASLASLPGVDEELVAAVTRVFPRQKLCIPQRDQEVHRHQHHFQKKKKNRNMSMGREHADNAAQDPHIRFR